MRSIVPRTTRRAEDTRGARGAGARTSHALHARHLRAPSTIGALHVGHGTPARLDSPDAPRRPSRDRRGRAPCGRRATRRTRVGSAGEREQSDRVGLRDRRSRAQPVPSPGKRDERLLAVRRDDQVGRARVEGDVPQQLAVARSKTSSARPSLQRTSARRPRRKSSICSGSRQVGMRSPRRTAPEGSHSSGTSASSARSTT